MKIKLCGFKEKESLEFACLLNIDFVGFVFEKKSPRNISLKEAQDLAKIIPNRINKVAVVVDKNIEELQEIYHAINPQYFQLHGQETVAEIIEIRKNFPKIGIIKAFLLENEENLPKIADFTNFVDFFLFDAKIAGSGKVFDWSLLKKMNIQKDWFLSGGLNCDNIKIALEKTGTNMVDTSSGIEEIKGIKSKKLILEFVRRVEEFKKC